jgi:hypothetical protein
MLVALLAMVILPDLPTNSRGFTAEELEVAQLRLLEDVGEADTDAGNEGVFDGLMMAVKDVKIYVMMLTLTAYVVGLSFNAFFVSATWTRVSSPPDTRSLPSLKLLDTLMSPPYCSLRLLGSLPPSSPS